MRVKKISAIMISSSNCLFDFFIRISSAGNQGFDGFVVIVKQCLNTREIARRTYIHGISNGSDRRTWLVLTGLQIFIENVITIIGSHKAPNRESHFPSNQTGSQIAKISTRYAHSQSISQAEPLHLCISIEVIKGLRQQSG